MLVEIGGCQVATGTGEGFCCLLGLQEDWTRCRSSRCMDRPSCVQRRHILNPASQDRLWLGLWVGQGAFQVFEFSSPVISNVCPSSAVNARGYLYRLEHTSEDRPSRMMTSGGPSQPVLVTDILHLRVLQSSDSEIYTLGAVFTCDLIVTSETKQTEQDYRLTSCYRQRPSVSGRQGSSHTHVHTGTHTHTHSAHTGTRTHMHTQCTHTGMCTCMHTQCAHRHTHMHSAHTCAHRHTHTCTYNAHTGMCTCMHTQCAYRHAHTCTMLTHVHTGTCTHRRTQMHTHIHTHARTHSAHTGAHTCTHRHTQCTTRHTLAHTLCTQAHICIHLHTQCAHRHTHTCTWAGMGALSDVLLAP